MNEQEKKRANNERTFKIDHSTFTPLVFSISGKMGRECQKFYLRLAQMNMKRETFRNRFQVIGFEQKVCFGLLKSNLLCFKGFENSMQKNSGI